MSYHHLPNGGMRRCALACGTTVRAEVFAMTKNQMAHMSPELKADLARIYPGIDKEIRRWMGGNGYSGWRLGIDSHGNWISFVTND